MDIRTSSPWNQIRRSESSNEEGYSTSTKIILDSMLFFIIFVAISGNLLVCIAIFIDRHLLIRKSNFLLVSLAVADMLVSMAVMPFAILNDVHGRWMFGAIFCKIWMSCDIMCSTASILNLCVIALDRFKYIRDPMHYQLLKTTPRVVVMIAAVWIMSVLLSFGPLYMGWHEQAGQTDASTLAKLGVCLLLLNPTYATVSSAIGFYIPCFVIVSIYTSVCIQTRRHVKSTVCIRPRADRLRKHKYGRRTRGAARRSDQRTAITLGIIMGVFLLCWLPFFVINPFAAFCPPCVPRKVFQTATWFGYVNSCLNPFIYSIFNSDFRRAFRRIFNIHQAVSIFFLTSSSPSNRESFTK